MKKYISVIFIFCLMSFGCIAQSNNLFNANQTKIANNTFKEIILKKVLLSDCYLRNNSPVLMEIFFFNEHKNKYRLSVRFNILGYFETDYKYYGYFIINKTIFLVKGAVPKGLFVRTKNIRKFAFIKRGKNIDVGSCPSWNFSYKGGKLSFIWNECGE